MHKYEHTLNIIEEIRATERLSFDAFLAILETDRIEISTTPIIEYYIDKGASAARLASLLASVSLYDPIRWVLLLSLRENGLTDLVSDIAYQDDRDLLMDILVSQADISTSQLDYTINILRRQYDVVISTFANHLALRYADIKQGVTYAA